MNVQNMKIDASFENNERVVRNPCKIAYGTSSERTGMTSAVKSLFGVGSQYYEVDTGKVYVMSTSDWREV